jgi:hypothetical protein
MPAVLDQFSFLIARFFQKYFSHRVSRMPTREVLGTCDAKRPASVVTQTNTNAMRSLL